MITGFNKKELRLFEKYRKQWNRDFPEYKVNFSLFIHLLDEYAFLYNQALVKKNIELIHKHAKLVKMPSVIKFNHDLIF